MQRCCILVKLLCVYLFLAFVKQKMVIYICHENFVVTYTFPFLTVDEFVCYQKENYAAILLL